MVGNRSHLAFGAGPHTCPAQDPARLITRTAVDTLRHRLPDLEIAVPEEQLPWITSPWSKGLAGLPVRFSAPQLAADAPPRHRFTSGPPRRPPVSPTRSRRPQMTDGRCPVPHADPVPHDGPAPHRLDPDDQHAVNDRLRARGAAVPVLLPGDVPAYAVTRHEALKDFLAHPDVAKDARHFTALQNGELPPGWPLLTFATVQGMTTADGDDHRRLRSLVSKAFTAAPGGGAAAAHRELTADAARPAGRGGRRGPGRGGGSAPPLRAAAADGRDLPAPRASTPSTRTGCTSCPTRSSPPASAPSEAMAANREMVAILGQVAAARPSDPATTSPAR